MFNLDPRFPTLRASGMARRPNLLIIMADQLAPQVLPAYGHPRARTPHLDRLAEEGVVFENAYCNFPLCAPARFSLLSGRLPSRIDTFDNAAEFSASVPTFHHYLRLAGYRTCLAGKMHFIGPDQLHGYEERITTDVYPANFIWSPDWRLDGESWLEWYHSMRAVLDSGVQRRSVNVAYDDEVEFEAVRWMHEHADGGDDRPFALTVSFISPHDPYLAPPRWWEIGTGISRSTRRGSPDIPLDERDPHSRRHWFLTGRHREAIGEFGRASHAPRLLRDDELRGREGRKRLLETLEDIGAAADTLVVFTSDHGDSLGERGLFFKMSFYRVVGPGAAHRSRPVCIRCAPRAGKRLPSSISFPTLLEVAGDGNLPELSRLRSTADSLVPLASGGARGLAGSRVCAEYTAEGVSGPLLMVRKGSYKLILNPEDPPLLFDLDADPDEIENLAGTPASSGVQAELEAVAARTWDVSALDRAVRESQAARRLVSGALGTGARTSWDFQPGRDASKAYFRESGDIQESYSGFLR